MSWISQVPAWVIPLLQAYVIPDNATVQSGVDFDSFDAGDGDETSVSQQASLSYPGLIPSYSLEPIVIPTTNGVNYTLKAKKGVGFYGCKTEVISYDENRINRWEFPITQRKFGWITIGRESGVLSEHRISFVKQFHLCKEALFLLLNYDDQFDTTNFLNSADKLVATQLHAQLSPTVRVKFRFLPTWEVWAVKFFQSNSS